MSPQELKNAIAPFYPAIVLDHVISRKTRHAAAKVFKIFSIIFLVLVLVAWASAKFPLSGSPDVVSAIKFMVHSQTVFLGGFFVALSLWLVLQAANAFYSSYYFQGLATVLPETGLSDKVPTVTFEAAEVLEDGILSSDFTDAFIESRLGRRLFTRLGIFADSLREFLRGRVHVVAPADFKFSPSTQESQLDFSDVARVVVGSDAELFKFLSVHDVTPAEFAGAADWIERTEKYFRNRERFWSKDSLGRIKGIGKDWAYGGAYTLEKFARDITHDSTGDLEELTSAHKKERDELEAVLARSGAANAILVADEGAGAIDVVRALAERISEGSVMPSLEHKRIFLFDANAFVAAVKTKAQFESELLHILNESVRAGHIIFVVADLPAFIVSAQNIGVDVIGLMDPYLASYDFQMIAIANFGAFHQTLETDSKILHRFEKILVKEADATTVMRALEDEALMEESKAGILFTYQSLSAVAEGVKRYFSEGVAVDQALHFLSEVVPVVLAKKKKFVERTDVLSVIETKTGIPTGTVTAGERDKLLNLESILHQRIIGQDEAIVAISNAMRRSRSDIENPERPMGSFLFLGPTGVGKTETTKALAAVFFGKEESIIRLDMSEYQTDDALKRLIGSFEDGKTGVLVSKLREQSYGVLLLDEFEKTSKQVLDLFLQILDEGFFSDMTGKRVNARNLIIVATSNAGSDLIWNLMREGKDLTGSKDAIVNEIINRGIFKPELLNRFDGVILFHPLSTDNLKVIAGLMLKKLQKRLVEKGIELVINDALLESVMKAGTDPEFGARPMNRAIQEKVEEVIAKKIIAGDIKAGSRLELTAAELA